MSTEHSQHVLNTLREYGYQLEECSRTDVDADFVVTPPDGGDKFKLQIWNGFVIAEKNRRRGNIYIALHDGKSVYCYPHNAVLEEIERKFSSSEKVIGSRSWRLLGYYFISPQRRQSGQYFTSWLLDLLEPHRIPKK